jgi:hypothetical protein
MFEIKSSSELMSQIDALMGGVAYKPFAAIFMGISSIFMQQESCKTDGG